MATKKIWRDRSYSENIQFVQEQADAEEERARRQRGDAQDDVTLTSRPNQPFAGIKSAKRRRESISNDEGSTESSKRQSISKNSVEKKKDEPSTTKDRCSICSWRNSVANKNSHKNSDLVTLHNIRELIGNCLKNPTLLTQLRQKLHELPFYSFLETTAAPMLIVKSKLREEEGSQGLPLVYKDQTGTFPPDIRADALELHNRWSRMDRCTNIFRGIEMVKTKSETGSDVRSTRLDQSYDWKAPKVSFGENDLVNGQWWPQQICLIRDGCHGETEAGISGQSGKGAASIVLSKGGYEDKDNGETISYCGTRSVDGSITANTELMITAHRLHVQIRVIRSHQAPNKAYTPKVGFRYDGLYEITGEVLLDPQFGHYRFDLERVPGQDPIRCKGTVGERPTAEEQRAYRDDRDKRGLS